jgi:hypothetical protein
MVAQFFSQTLRRRPVAGLELVKVALGRFDKVRLRNEESLFQDFGQSFGQGRRNDFGLAGVNRNRKGTGIAIVAPNRAIGFPDAIGVTGGVILVTNEQNLRPEVLIEAVLRLDHREVITGRDDAAVEDNEVIFPRDEGNLLLLAGAHR